MTPEQPTRAAPPESTGIAASSAPAEALLAMLDPRPHFFRPADSSDDDDVDVDVEDAGVSAGRASTPHIVLPVALHAAQIGATNYPAPASAENASSAGGLSVLPPLSRPQDLATPLSPVTFKGHPKSHTHRLVMRQHPRLSRSCGYGEKAERRPVDPPPVIQLDITSHGGAGDHSHLYNPYYFMYASLIDPDVDEEINILHDGKTRSMTGSIVSSLYRLRDLDNKEGAFFVFPDLSVRKEGKFRLKFSLFEICDTEMFFCASIVSNIFTVYSSKKFPGTDETTFLSKAFADQGIKIRVRKETRVRRSSVQEDLDGNNAVPVVRKRESLFEDSIRKGIEWAEHIDKLDLLILPKRNRETNHHLFTQDLLLPVKCMLQNKFSAIRWLMIALKSNSMYDRTVNFKILHRHRLGFMKTFRDI
ncbi:hypothetical protein HDU83_005845 [Entophlyctis luteolus]|nr:hypothetical protein HDU83_005845 [Entophlyctis luteolus]